MEAVILIKNGRVVDPGTKFEGTADLLIRDGVIAEVGENLPVPAGCSVVDASGLTVLPGIVDLHVHLRDPGQTYKEEIRTAGEAAAHGGVTSLLAMPNTVPPVDSAALAAEVERRAAAETGIHVYQSSAITQGMRGEALVDIEYLCDSGVRAFSEDGKSVMDPELMRQALVRIGARDGLVADHCEEIGLVRGGVMNDDACARRLGLPGILNSAEDVIAARDVILAAEAGTRIHLCHCSTAASARIVRAAKSAGARVSAEVCPHHFTLTTEDIPGDDANFKMNPPLRTREDLEALKEGLSDGTFEVISTDHAPHGEEEKSRGFLRSPFGIVGLETSVALTYTELVKGGVITLMQMAEKMCLNPARILGIPAGTLTPGAPADVSVFDFRTSHRINPANFRSKGRNTPFGGRDVYGRTVLTIAGGRAVYSDGR